MGKNDYELGAAEFEVLRILWDQGAQPVREVMNHLHAMNRRVAYTTVQTLLIRLEQKGFVTSNKRGLAHVFRAKLTRDRVRKSRLKAMVDQLYDGAAGALVLQLVRNEKLSSNELSELASLIENLDTDADKT